MSDLQPRQVEILRRLATGESRGVVALELGLSTHTVKNHLSRTFHALDVTTLIEAYAKLGWLVPK